MKILIAWELGSNWGHLATLLPLATRLRDAGHGVMFAVRGLDGDLSPLQRAGFDYVASPIAIAPLQRLHNLPVRGYADVLARCGFADTRTLMQLTHAWQSLLRWIQPDLVVCKYAPLAEFATRICPVQAIGTGFELPPLAAALPLYGQVQRSDAQNTQVVESHILQAMQAVEKACGFSLSVRASHAFSHVSRACLSWPELDHFGARAGMDYLGPVEDLPPTHKFAEVVPAEWFQSSDPVSLVYLRLGYAWMQAFVQMVRARFPQRRWLVVDPTLDVDQCRELCTAHIIVLNAPVDWFNKSGSHIRMDSLICHGGHGSIAQALFKELRLMVLPQHTEQLLLAHRVLASHMGGVAVVGLPVLWDSFGAKLSQLLQGPAPAVPVAAHMGQTALSMGALVQRIEAFARDTTDAEALHV